MMNGDDTDSNISNAVIGSKKSQNKTSIEYRTAFSHDVAHLLALQTICKQVDEDKFTNIIKIMLLG